MGPYIGDWIFLEVPQQQAAEVRLVVESNLGQDREGVEQYLLGLGEDPQQVEGQVQDDKQDQGEVHKLETGSPRVGKWGVEGLKAGLLGSGSSSVVLGGLMVTTNGTERRFD